MNQRQRAFCEAYLLSGNATEAAIKAGYSPKSARSIGQRLLTYTQTLHCPKLKNWCRAQRLLPSMRSAAHCSWRWRHGRIKTV